MTRRKTRAEAEIEAKLQTLDPSSKRYGVLSSARDFKVAWIELGQRLTKVKEEGTWEEWGYSSFEAYCRRELRVRRDTANKLTRSFSFLRDHEPDSLENRTDRELPPLDVVDLLSRAQEQTKITEPQLEAIREEVFSQDASMPTRSQVVKRFREVDPEAFRKGPVAVKEAPTGPLSQGDLRKALLLAERLFALVENQPGLSDKAVGGIKQAATELRELFEAQSEEAKSA